MRRGRIECEAQEKGKEMKIFKDIKSFSAKTQGYFYLASLIFVIALFTFLTLKWVFFMKKGKFAENTIVFTSLVACLLSFPIPLALNGLVHFAFKNAALNELVQSFSKKEAAKLKIENENLKKEALLLKAAQLSALQLEQINELALIKTNIKQTKVWQENVNDVEERGIIWKNYLNDMLLLVNVYDIDCKFGIDFTSIRVQKTGEKSIKVSGIKPIFIGASKNSKETIVKEIRRYEYDKNGEMKNVQIKNDKVSERLASKKAEELDNVYRASLQNMENWDFIQSAVTKMGENYVRLIFAPVYKNIEFTDILPSESLPLNEYLKKEIQKIGEKKVELPNYAN